MCEPKFTVGDKAEFKVLAGWTAVRIESQALLWAADPHGGFVHQVHHLDMDRGQMPFLAHSDHLRPAERVEPCPGKHRHAPTSSVNAGGWQEGPWERRVD